MIEQPTSGGHGWWGCKEHPWYVFDQGHGAFRLTWGIGGPPEDIPCLICGGPTCQIESIHEHVLESSLHKQLEADRPWNQPAKPARSPEKTQRMNRPHPEGASL